MNDKEKIKLADMVLDFLSSQTKKSVDVARHVGYTNKQIGFAGMKLLEPGAPVFEYMDRYIIYMETLDGKNSHEVKYYKDDFRHCVDLS